MPPKSKFNGFAGEPTITAIVMAIPKITPTITNLIFISKVTNAQIKTDCIKISPNL
jgi:hypothetical protein